MAIHNVALLACLAALPGAAGASEYRVDNRDVAGLIAALQRANSAPGAHVIHLFPGGIYTLALTDSNGLGLPPIRANVRIEGHRAEIRRYADVPMALLAVDRGGVAHVLDLTLAEGNLGAIRNAGRLTLDRVAVTDSNGEAGQAIVVNDGTLVLRDSLIGYNHLHALSADGGIVINRGEMDIDSTRFVANSVARTTVEAVAAGAVLNFGRLTAERVIFDGNEVTDSFGGLAYSAVINRKDGVVSGLDANNVISEIEDPL